MSIQLDKDMFEGPGSINDSFVLVSLDALVFNHGCEASTWSSLRWVFCWRGGASDLGHRCFMFGKEGKNGRKGI